MNKFERMFQLCWSQVALLLVLVSCGGGHSDSSVSPQQVEQDTNRVIIQVKDSTLYGKAGDCGMSTFCLITDNGDTIVVSRNSEDGIYGTIMGDLILDDRFCMTVSPDKSVLVEAINLTQLMRFLPDCRIINGLVVIPGSDREKGDTLTLISLSSDSLVYSDHLGKKYTCR